MEWRSIRVGAGAVCRGALSRSDLGGWTMGRPAARLGMDPRPLAAVSDFCGAVSHAVGPPIRLGPWCWPATLIRISPCYDFVVRATLRCISRSGGKIASRRILRRHEALPVGTTVSFLDDRQTVRCARRSRSGLALVLALLVACFSGCTIRPLRVRLIALGARLMGQPNLAGRSVPTCMHGVALTHIAG